MTLRDPPERPPGIYNASDLTDIDLAEELAKTLARQLETIRSDLTDEEIKRLEKKIKCLKGRRPRRV